MSGLEADPAALLADGERWAGALRERGLLAERAGGQLDEVLIRSRGERIDLSDDPLLVVMLCGPTAVGKSSLINAVAGAPISTPGLGATTAHAIVYVHERDDPGRLFEYGEALGQLGRAGASLVRHARDELLHKVLVDTPDIDSALKQHAAVTEALVGCADLVVFVTSPEKYKNLRSARWVAEHSQQRAIAFVLNKWDREGIGLQYDRRDLVTADFRQLLAAEGFSDPLVFVTSSLGGDGSAAAGLGALQTWLADGLDRALATAIQERRRRSAWGRLGAAVAAAVPVRLAGHPFLAVAHVRLAESGGEARRLVAIDVPALSPRGLDRSIRPPTPGLLGSWMNIVDGIAAAAPARVYAALRAGPDVLLPGAAQAGAGGFGRAAADLLKATTQDLLAGAEARRLALGPVGATWAAEADRLHRHLPLLPAELEAELAAAASSPSPRRSLGLAILWGTEALLGLVLAVALWRLATGFVEGRYASGRLISDTIALVAILLLCGQAAVRILFPPLGERLRTSASDRGRALVDEGWRRSRAALDEQVETADRLAVEGRDLMARIDAMVRAVGDGAMPDAAARLFGVAPPAVLLPDPLPQIEPAQPGRPRRPRLE